MGKVYRPGFAGTIRDRPVPAPVSVQFLERGRDRVSEAVLRPVSGCLSWQDGVDNRSSQRALRRMAPPRGRLFAQEHQARHA